MSETAQQTAPLAEPALVVFGLDEKGKAHASWFEAGEVELATTAASLMAMHAMAVTSDEHRAVATSLPRGRVFASGRAFVPFAKTALYARLRALAGNPPEPVRIKVDKPAEAKAETVLDEQEIAEAVVFDPAVLPVWAGVKPDSLVLATDGFMQGWFEAVVTEVKDDLYVLRWRDFTNDPSFVRRREHLILYPAPVEAA